MFQQWNAFGVFKVYGGLFQSFEYLNCDSLLIHSGFVEIGLLFGVFLADNVIVALRQQSLLIVFQYF